MSRLLLADLYLKLAADFQGGNPYAGEINAKTRVFLKESLFTGKRM